MSEPKKPGDGKTFKFISDYPDYVEEPGGRHLFIGNNKHILSISPNQVFNIDQDGWPVALTNALNAAGVDGDDRLGVTDVDETGLLGAVTVVALTGEGRTRGAGQAGADQSGRGQGPSQ